MATPEASAKSHTNNTINAVLRLARVFEKSFMLMLGYEQFMLNGRRDAVLILIKLMLHIDAF